MPEAKAKQAFIVRSFTDANFEGSGAERQFVGGAIETLPEGVFANYEHAGLVRSPSASERGAATKAAASEKLA